MNYGLPTSLEVCGHTYDIRSDYRAVLDICTALSDTDLGEQDKCLATLDIFYPDFEGMPPEHYQEAIKACFDFISCGDNDEKKKNTPQLVSWEKDFKYIVAPVNRILGGDIRGLDYLHWWTFISAYMEIGGDCTFAQIVGIRSKQAKGKQLDKSEREWYSQNRDIVDIKTNYSQQEDAVFAVWAGQK